MIEDASSSDFDNIVLHDYEMEPILRHLKNTVRLMLLNE